MERKIEGKTELEFLNWLYTVIGDDDVDYMWSLSGRIGELKATEHIDKMSEVAKGCGARTRVYEKLNVFKLCGDNIGREDGDPNLCSACHKRLMRLIEFHKQRFNPSFKVYDALCVINETEDKDGE